MSEIRDSILPAGFGLDQFGIIVHEQFALPRPPSNTRPPAESDLPAEPSDGASDSQLSDPPETDTEPSEPTTGSQTEAERTISQPLPMPIPHTPETNSANPPAGMSLRGHTRPSYKETPSRGSRTTRSTPAKASAARAPPPPCCPVPSTLLGALDNTTTFKSETLWWGSPPLATCVAHSRPAHTR
jgi:hypothetical protein